MMTLNLPSRCDRAAAEALKPELTDGVAAGHLVLDGTAVAQIGQAMLQLLVAARRTASAQGRRLDITPSEAMRGTARMTGLEPLLFEGPAA